MAKKKTSKKATAAKKTASKAAAKKTTAKKAGSASKAAKKTTVARTPAVRAKASKGAKSATSGAKKADSTRSRSSAQARAGSADNKPGGTKAGSSARKTTAKKSPVKKTATKPPTKKSKPATLDETPTEELWALYRKQAVKRGAKEQAKLDELRNTLIERHYPLVKYIAERLLQTLPKSIELDDLVSAGLFGLMDAIRGFDPSRGIKFKTYCSTRIRGAILDQLRSQDWVPRLVRLKASRIERALQRLTAEYGREPTHAELARNLEMDHQDLVKEIQEARARAMFSLSEKWEDDDGSVEKVEILEDKTSIDPVNELNRRDLMGFITRALTHKERFIIEQYYQYGHTMREVGEMLALTESRVCQIHSNVMNRLKGLLGKKQGSLLS